MIPYHPLWLYFDRILNGTGICIKDAAISSINEISSGCNGTSEIWLACPGTNSTRNCSLNGSQYKVQGLSHSGVKEQSTFCGDGTCNGAETCSSCSNDCGCASGYSCVSETCTADNSGSSSNGGGGSSSGGSSSSSSSISTVNNTVQGEEVNETEDNEVRKISEDDKGGGITGTIVGLPRETKMGIGVAMITWIIASFVLFKRIGIKSQNL